MQTLPAEVWKVYCAIEFVSVIEASKPVAIKVESRSCTHAIDDLLLHAPSTTGAYDQVSYLVSLLCNRQN